MSFDWKAVVGTVAPGIATALGGPLAGMAVKTLSDHLLGHPDGSEDDVAQAIAGASPDILLKMKEADQAFTLSMQQAGVDLEKIAAGDRDSARKREIATGDNATPRILAGIVVLGFFGVVYSVLSGYVDGLKDPSIATLIGTLIGYVSAKADQVVSYYFGSSAGSDKKTDLMHKQSQGK